MDCGILSPSETKMLVNGFYKLPFQQRACCNVDLLKNGLPLYLCTIKFLYPLQRKFILRNDYKARLLLSHRHNVKTRLMLGFFDFEYRRKGFWWSSSCCLLFCIASVNLLATRVNNFERRFDLNCIIVLVTRVSDFD